MSGKDGIRSQVRSFVETFARQNNQKWDLAIFSSYVTMMIDRSVGKDVMIRDLKPLVHEHSERFVNDLFKLLGKSVAKQSLVERRSETRGNRYSPRSKSRDSTRQSGKTKHNPKSRDYSEDYYSSYSSDAEQEPVMPSAKRDRYIIYAAGLEDNLNTVPSVLSYFNDFGAIKAIQVNREEKFALIEYFELKSAYLAVTSKRNVMENRFIRVGFAVDINEKQLREIREGT
jgi:hypothetical protein